MAAILGDAYPDLYAAIGVQSGLATGSARDVMSAMSAMKAGASTSASSANTHRSIFVFFTATRTRRCIRSTASAWWLRGGEVRVAMSGRKANHERGRSGNGREYTRRSCRGASEQVVAEH